MTLLRKLKLKTLKYLKILKDQNLKEQYVAIHLSNLDFDYDVPMLDAQFVNLEQGTGIVHCAPSHGPDDFNFCLKNNISSKYTVDNSGFILKKYLILQTHIFKADPIVIEKLKEQKQLLKK